MTTDSLHAFLEGVHVGVFTRARTGAIAFDYDTVGGPGTPVSLSLPRVGATAAGAPAAFLDNLLPDRQAVRDRWARERELPDAEPFTLLGTHGENVAGALVLSPEPDLPQREPFGTFDQLWVEVDACDCHDELLSLYN